jgi:hypothetical protein
VGRLVARPFAAPARHRQGHRDQLEDEAQPLDDPTDEMQMQTIESALDGREPINDYTETA